MISVLRRLCQRSLRRGRQFVLAQSVSGLHLDVGANGKFLKCESFQKDRPRRCRSLCMMRRWIENGLFLSITYEKVVPKSCEILTGAVELSSVSSGVS
jgi:hypothetical protein